MGSCGWLSVRKLRQPLLILVVGVSTVHPASAEIPFFESAPVRQLLALDHQPTVTEIKAAFGGKLPEKNPFGRPTQSLLGTARERAPGVIAAFEKAFPGATYAALGRDAAFLGDILDAFYGGLGQKRVVRVGASGQSLTGNEEAIVEFLRPLGLDLARLDELPPFVMFDQTRYRETSQSQTYLRAVTRVCARRASCDLDKLRAKFNFINTGPNVDQMYRANIVNADSYVADFLDGQRTSWPPDAAPQAILSVDVPQELVYTTEYHGKFGVLHEVDGDVRADPGSMSRRRDRLQILADVYEIIRITSTEEFREGVRQAAADLHFEFPEIRVTEAKDIRRIQGAATDETDPARLVPARFEKALRELEGRRKEPLFNYRTFVEAQVADAASLGPYAAELLGLRLDVRGFYRTSTELEQIAWRLIRVLSTRTSFDKFTRRSVAKALGEGWDREPLAAIVLAGEGSRSSSEMAREVLRWSFLQTFRTDRRSDERASSKLPEWCRHFLAAFPEGQLRGDIKAMEMIDLIYGKETESLTAPDAKAWALPLLLDDLNLDQAETVARLQKYFDQSPRFGVDWAYAYKTTVSFAKRPFELNREMLRWRLRSNGVAQPRLLDWVEVMDREGGIRFFGASPNGNLLASFITQSSDAANWRESLEVLLRAVGGEKILVSHAGSALIAVLNQIPPNDEVARAEMRRLYRENDAVRAMMTDHNLSKLSPAEKGLVKKWTPGLARQCVFAITGR